MKKNDVKVGVVYSAKVSGKSAAVRIDRENPRGGWDGTNMKTNKPVRIKSAQRLRGKAIWPPASASKADTAAAPVPAEGKKAGKVASGAHEAHKSPQGNRKAQGGPRGDPAGKGRTRGKPGRTRAKLSGLVAATLVLAEASEPLKPETMVKAMLAKGYWSTGGKTPAATISAAIGREIAAKAKQSRFRKTAPGTFELTKAGKAAAQAAR